MGWRAIAVRRLHIGAAYSESHLLVSVIEDRTDRARVADVAASRDARARWEPAATVIVELRREVAMTKASVTAALAALAILTFPVGGGPQENDDVVIDKEDKAINQQAEEHLPRLLATCS
jgi:hypothetical protein